MMLFDLLVWVLPCPHQNLEMAMYLLVGSHSKLVWHHQTPIVEHCSFVRFMQLEKVANDAFSFICVDHFQALKRHHEVWVWQVLGRCQALECLLDWQLYSIIVYDKCHLVLTPWHQYHSWKCRRCVVSTDHPKWHVGLTFWENVRNVTRYVLKFCCPYHARQHDMLCWDDFSQHVGWFFWT